MKRLLALLVLTAAVATRLSAQSRTVTLTEGFQDPVVAPDGQTMAFALHGKIWTGSIRGGDAKQLTFGSGWDTHPAWSPDGRFLAFARLTTGSSELVLFARETGHERTLYRVNSSGERISPPIYSNAIGQIAWRPRGNGLVFIVEETQFTAHLWSVSMAVDSAPKQLTRGTNVAEWSFALSPDGQRAAVTLVGRTTGVRDLFITTLDSAAARRVTTNPAHEFAVQWTKDGRSLVYVERDNGVERVVVRDVARDSVRVLFESPYDGKQLALSPTESRAVLVAGRRLYELDLQTGKRTAIPMRATFHLAEQAPGNLLITNVRLWDGTGAPTRDSSWVLARAGVIVRVGRGTIPPDAMSGVSVIDGRGQFLMPGLIDNHYHYWHQFVFAAPRLLGLGITSIRDPGSEISETLNFRQAVRDGILSGPDIYSAGPLIDGPCPIHPMVDVQLTRVDAAAPLVRALQAQGVDAIKVYHCLTPDIARAVIAEARRLGLPVTGDLGNVTLWDQAVDAGITGLNHAYVYRPAYLPEASRAFKQEEEPGIQRARFQLQTNIPVNPDRPEVDSVLARMARKGVAIDPTLTAFAVADSDRRALGLEEGARALQRWKDMERFVRKAVDAKVMLLAGTDDGDLFEELEEYEHIGVPRSTILEAVTANGAKWLGKSDVFGTIQAGRRANLILVDGDPLSRIADLRRRSYVIKDGRIVNAR